MCHKRKNLEKEHRLNESTTISWRVFVPALTKLNRESVFESKPAKYTIFQSKSVVCQKLVPMTYMVLKRDMVSSLDLYCQGPRPVRA